MKSSTLARLAFWAKTAQRFPLLFLGKMFSGQHGAKDSLNAKTSGFSRRVAEGVEIRKSKAQGALEKKRRQQQDGSPFSGLSGPSDDPWSYNVDTPTTEVPLALLPKFVSLVNSSNIRDVHQGVMLIRKLLAVQEDAPTNEVVEAGVAPILVKCMEQTENTRLQFEASWALSNIASGSKENTMYVLQTNAVPLWIQHFSSHDPDVVEQAAWAIGNIAGEGFKCRDYCLECGALNPLLNVITGPIADQKLAVMQNSVWALSNLCRFKPCPRLNLVASAIPVVLHLTRNPTPEIVFDALWTLSYISDGPDRVDSILEAGAIPVVIDMMSAPHTRCHMPALRTIGNVIAGSDRQTQVALNAGALVKLRGLLDPRCARGLRKEAMWTVSNVAAGPPTQIDLIVQAQLFPVIIQTMSAREPEVMKEAVWTAANIATNGSPQQIHFMVECGLLEKLTSTLGESNDVNVVVVALETLGSVLEVGDKFAEESQCANAYVDILKEQGCATVLENLAEMNNNESIRDLAQQIGNSYFASGNNMQLNNMTSGNFSGGGGFEGGNQQGGFNGDDGEFNF